MTKVKTSLGDGILHTEVQGKMYKRTFLLTKQHAGLVQEGEVGGGRSHHEVRYFPEKFVQKAQDAELIAQLPHYPC